MKKSSTILKLMSLVAMMLILSGTVAYGMMSIPYDKDLYGILGVAPDATKYVINKAYKKLVLVHHPDKGGDVEKFKEIGQAYEVLSNDAARGDYDERRKYLPSAPTRRPETETTMKRPEAMSPEERFYQAIDNGDKSTIEELIASGFDIKNIRGTTALHAAAGARDNNGEIMSLLVGAGIDVNTQDKDKETPLHFAARKGMHENVVWLLNNDIQKADVNIQNNQGRTPLMVAVSFAPSESKALEVLRALFYARNPKVDLQDRDGDSALHDAARNGYDDVIRLLLRNRADANLLDRRYHRTPLFYVRNVNGARMLIAGGAKLDIRDKNGATILYRFAENGNVDIVRLLIEAGMDVDSVDNAGKKAIDEAKKELESVNSDFVKGKRENLREVIKMLDEASKK